MLRRVLSKRFFTSYPKNIENLIRLLQKLPEVGRRTAERYGFDLLLHWTQDARKEISSQVQALDTMRFCPICKSLADNVCLFCDNPNRCQDLLCIVGSVREVFTIEETKEFSGLYHVLDAMLSPLDGRCEEQLGLERLLSRLQTGSITEIILALDSSLEGDATSLYLKEVLAGFPVQISRLAFGIPVGATLEYVDGGTLARAFSSRGVF